MASRHAKNYAYRQELRRAGVLRFISAYAKNILFELADEAGENRKVQATLSDICARTPISRRMATYAINQLAHGGFVTITELNGDHAGNLYELHVPSRASLFLSHAAGVSLARSAKVSRPRDRDGAAVGTSSRTDREVGHG